jgi:hypothetical protein
MIQTLIYNDTPSSPTWRSTSNVVANVAPNFSVTPTIVEVDVGGTKYYTITYPFFLFQLTSQATGKTKLFTREGFYYATGVGVDKHERYIALNFYYSVSSTQTEDLTEGKVRVGTTEFPLGFYDFTIYETLTDGQLNPANATATLYTGLLNMKGSESTSSDLNFESVQYKEYTTNDADTESVYLTNPTV